MFAYALWLASMQARPGLSIERFEQLHQQLTSLIAHECQGPHNGKVCPPQVLKRLCIADDVHVPDINYTDKFTPWISMGRFTWTANDYNDFVVWYVFFSGLLFEDVERESLRAAKFYFESGASNGIHASQTYTFGEQLGWSGLMTEVSNCGPCQARINHPSAKFVHAGICETDRKIPFDANNQQKFCPKQILCALAPFTEVDCRSLKSLFLEHGVTVVDFLSLDMEEATPTAWRSIDHESTNVRVAVVEKWEEMPIDTDTFEVVVKNNDYFLWRKKAFKQVSRPCHTFSKMKLSHSLH